MSILGGILGLINGNQAANAVAVGNHDAMQGVLGANQTSVNSVNNAGASAINAVNNATGSANNTLAQGFNRGSQVLSPYISAGEQGLSGLQGMADKNAQFSWDPSKIADDPAYQFRVQQGQEAINNSAAAHGLASSGNVLKDLTSFNSGTAAQFEDADFHRALSTFTTNQDTSFRNYAALAGLGQNATQQYEQNNQAFTLPMANNTKQAGYFEGATDTDLAKFLAGLSQGAAVQAGGFRNGQAQGTAARDINTGNQWGAIAEGVPNLFNVLSGIFGGGKDGDK